MEVNKNNIYTVLSSYECLYYKVISEEYKVINNEEHYYIGVDVRISNSNRIGFSQIKVSSDNYKQIALENVLVNIINIYNNNTNNINSTNNNNVKINNSNNNTNVNYNNNTNINNSSENNNINFNNYNNNNTNNNNNKKFSHEVIAAMDNFKKANNITTDEKLLAYIQQFNPNIQSKKQLNEQTVINFLKWADKYIEK